MDEHGIVSSALLETELRRLAVRLKLDQFLVTDLLARVDLIDTPRSLFREAGLLPGNHLRSLDALHLTTALRVDCEVLVAYDPTSSRRRTLSRPLNPITILIRSALNQESAHFPGIAE